MDTIYAALASGLLLGFLVSRTGVGGHVRRFADGALMYVVYVLVFLVGASSGKTLAGLAAEGDPWLAVHVLSYMLIPGLAGALFAFILSRVARRWITGGKP